MPDALRHLPLVGTTQALLGALLIGAAGLLAPEPAVGGEVSLESGVLFGTACASCHEGQCSGRLTFDLGAAGAAGHVRRHAGPVSDATIRELSTLLERMKLECAYPPFAAPIPQDAVWSQQLLDQLCAPSRRSCFIPLGSLKSGLYSLELAFDDRPHVHVEVITRTFDVLLDEPLATGPGQATAAFQVASSVEAFLRILAQEPLLVKQLKLERR